MERKSLVEMAAEVERPRERTDVHRPSAIVPSDYEYVAPEYLPVAGLGDAEFLMAMRKRIREHMARTGGTYSGHEHGGNCMVCGNVLATYTILFYHAKSNTYVRMGDICAQKCEMSYGEGEFNAFRRNVQNALEARAGKRKAEATLELAGLGQAWAIYEAPDTERQNWGRQEFTVVDIVNKLIKYGSISDKQTAFIGSLLRQIGDRANIAARRQAEDEAAAPLPVREGRMEIEGVVVTTKIVDSQFGSTLKMLVRADAGWKVWGTVPRSLNGVERGNRVRFAAQVEVSHDDPKFGFFKRPTQAEIVPAAAVPNTTGMH